MRIDLPPTAAWRHLDARTGFEVLFLSRDPDGYHLEGYTTAVEADEAWAVRYAITLDSNRATSSAHITGRSALGEHHLRLESAGAGAWLVDGKPMPELTGCLDVDLEASACTNALPVGRLGLEVGQAADAPAVYVRARDLTVERLEQKYKRLANDGEHSRYDYVAGSFNFRSFWSTTSTASCSTIRASQSGLRKPSARRLRPMSFRARRDQMERRRRWTKCGTRRRERVRHGDERDRGAARQGSNRRSMRSRSSSSAIAASSRLPLPVARLA